MKRFNYSIIWPVEPKYKPTVHCYYYCNSGGETIAGLTHNNGKIRKKVYTKLIPEKHHGFDIIASPLTKVVAPADSEVIFLYDGYKDNGTITNVIGNYVVLKHDESYLGQPVFSFLVHFSSCSVRRNDKVKSGEVIGLSGNSGGSRIPHVHISTRIGDNSQDNSVEPFELLPTRDFKSLSGILTTHDGFPESSIELYKSIMEHGWDYTVKVKTATDIPTSLAGEIEMIPRGTVLELVRRTGEEAVVEYNGKYVFCGHNDLIYTY